VRAPVGQAAPALAAAATVSPALAEQDEEPGTGLRNIGLTPSRFHSCAVRELHDAVSIMCVAQLGAELHAGEVDLVTAFLESLAGEQPQITRPILQPDRAETPRPQQ
jgi:cytochrome c peroxidase